MKTCLRLALCLFCLQLAFFSSAQQGQFESITISTDLVPDDVEVGVLLPPGYNESTDRLPLILWLHGGGGSSEHLENRYGHTVNAAWESGTLPPAVVVTPSAGRSFYMDYRDGSQLWESFVLAELLPEIRQRYRVIASAEGTYIGGISMGGMGSLRMAFKNPTLFAAVAAMEPAIEPAYSFSEIEAIDRGYRPQAVYEERFGRPVDEQYWQQNHPLYLARENLDELKSANLQIYIEVGNIDSLNLFRGAETLHRLFYDEGLLHEYRVVHKADHTGSSIQPRFSNVLEFLGRTIEGGF